MRKRDDAWTHEGGSLRVERGRSQMVKNLETRRLSHIFNVTGGNLSFKLLRIQVYRTVFVWSFTRPVLVFCDGSRLTHCGCARNLLRPGSTHQHHDFCSSSPSRASSSSSSCCFVVLLLELTVHSLRLSPPRRWHGILNSVENNVCVSRTTR